MCKFYANAVMWCEIRLKSGPTKEATSIRFKAVINESKILSDPDDGWKTFTE